MSLCFSLAAFKILFNFCHSNYDMSWFGSLWYTMFGTLCASCTRKSVSFVNFRKFSAIILSNTYFTLFSLSSPSGTPVMQMLVLLMLSHRSLKLFSFFKIYFSFCCSDWVISIILPSKLLLCSSVSSNLPLIPSSAFF